MGLLDHLRKAGRIASNPVSAMKSGMADRQQNHAVGDFMNINYGDFKDSSGNFATPGSGITGQPPVAPPVAPMPAMPGGGGLRQAASSFGKGSDSFGNAFTDSQGRGQSSIARAGEISQPRGSAFIPEYDDLSERDPMNRLAYKFSSLLNRAY